MNVLIIHAHPEPNSFNGAMTRTAVAFFESRGDAVKVSDLYAMGFDPTSDRRNFTTVSDASYYKQQTEELYATEHDGFATDIEAEIEKLEWCDLLIMQFPLWWFGMPAIMKGWVDRVLAYGRVYGFGKWYDDGACKGKKAMLSLTTGSGPALFTPDGLHGGMDAILFPINHGILRFNGFDALPPFVVYSPAHVDDATRKGYLRAYEQWLAGTETREPITYPSLHDFDPNTFERKA